MAQIQKLVLVHPSLLTQSRKRQLCHSGHPTFTLSRKSRSLGHDLNLQLPTDAHGFHETFDDLGKIFRISYFLLGSPELPKQDFFAQYAKSVKQIIFSGHICSIRSAIEIVSSLKACKSVQFYLGELEQLPFLNEKYSDEDSLKEDSIQPIDRVKSLHIKLSLGHTNNNKQLREVVDAQVAQVVKESVKLFPKLEKITTDLPGEGQYFDLINKSLGLWSDLKDDCKAEISASDQKVRVAIKAKVDNPDSNSALQASQSHPNASGSDTSPSSPLECPNNSEDPRSLPPQKQSEAQPFENLKMYNPESPTDDSDNETGIDSKRTKMQPHFAKYNQSSSTSTSFQTIAGTINNGRYAEQNRFSTPNHYGYWRRPDSTESSGTERSQKSQNLNKPIEIDLTQPNKSVVMSEANFIDSDIRQRSAKVDLCVLESVGGKDEEIGRLKVEITRLLGVLEEQKLTLMQVKNIARKYKTLWEETIATASRREAELRNGNKEYLWSGKNEECSRGPQRDWKGEDITELVYELVKQHLLRCQSEKKGTKNTQGDKFSELFDRR